MLAGGADLELGRQMEECCCSPPQPYNPPSQLYAPGSPGGDCDRLAEARAVPRCRRGDRIKGATGGPHTCSSPIHQGPEPLLLQSRMTRRLTRKGSSYGRAGSCYTHPAFTP